MHEVLVNRLGGLSLPRKSVVRLTDRPDMTLDVNRKNTTHTHTVKFDQSTRRFGRISFARLFKLTKHIALLVYLLLPHLLACLRDKKCKKDFVLEDSRRAVVSYWQKYIHLLLVNRLRGLSLLRNSVIRLSDRADMALDVKQQNNNNDQA